MLSEKIRLYANKLWKSTGESLGELRSAIQSQLDDLQGDKRILMELSYGSLPASDAASVEFSVLESFADHALMLRRNSPYCKDIPEDIFLHNVFYPRINSEDIVDCRRFFYDKLYPLTEGLGGKEAALAVNRWCAENMTYEMTDTRTINPITAYNCTLGRCGEESTFGVTALRSIGIPARQIYVPWWSHCDDNHAWVEVYVENGWHFLGACEPEPDLDKGWFVNASSRAMVICCRNYFDFTGDGLKDESLVQKKGICLAYNQIKRYARAVRTTVKLIDKHGMPAPDGWVRFYVENMAGLAEIAALQTDKNGIAELETGMGCMLIQAEFEGRFTWLKYKAENDCELSLCPDAAQPELTESLWDFEAPETGSPYNSRLTAAEQKEKTETIRLASEKRNLRLESYWLEKYNSADKPMQEVFHTAAAHGEKLWDFYSEYGIEAKEILLNLKLKDWRDADTEILAAHIEGSRKYNNDENFLKYIQNPRIGYEKLSDWRSYVENYFSAEEKKYFRENPEELWLWISENFKERDCRFHPVLWLQPEAALRLHAADEKGRRLLFVAILRTLGVAARLNPVDNRAEFWDNGAFKSPEAEGPKEKTTFLKLNVEKSMVPEQNFGLSRWKNGWQTLDLLDADFERLELPVGIYCLHTVNRLPNGNQLISHKTFELNTAAELNVKKRQASTEQMLSDYKVVLPVENSGLELQLYLEPGAEPTEHSLNELIDAKERVDALADKGLNLRFIIAYEKAGENSTFKKAVSAIKNVKVQKFDFSDSALEVLARALYLEPGLWPLITLSDGKTSFYASAGYSVGSIGLALQLAEEILK